MHSYPEKQALFFLFNCNWKSKHGNKSGKTLSHSPIVELYAFCRNKLSTKDDAILLYFTTGYVKQELFTKYLLLHIYLLFDWSVSIATLLTIIRTNSTGTLCISTAWIQPLTRCKQLKAKHSFKTEGNKHAVIQ